MYDDPYETGTPKYSTAQDIYDALCELVQTEEMSILSEIGVDVSYESQGYYYTDKGNVLKTQFEELSDYGNKIWLLDLAIFQINYNGEGHWDTNDFVFEALINPDLAKRLGFKKLFIEKMLKGDGKLYDKISEDFLDELQKLNRFDYYVMISTFNKVARKNGIELYGVSPYPSFSHTYREKILGLKLTEETKLIAECRAHLTAYDDFIFGLRVNQALHERQEQMHKQKVAELQASYDEKVKLLLAAADRAGLLPALTTELQRLETSGKTLLNKPY